MQRLSFAPMAGHAMRRTVVAIAVLTAVTAGCSSGARHSGSTATSTRSADAAASRPSTAAPSTAASTTSTTVALLSSAQLQGALLNAAEVGQSYTLQPSSASNSGSDQTTATGCLGLSREINAGPASGITQVEADFTAGQSGPFFAEVLLTEPPIQFDSDYSQSVKDLASCRNLTIDSAGSSIAFTLMPINFASGATAARLDGSLQGVQVNGYLAEQRIGQAALLFFYFQIRSGSSQQAYALYTQAAAKANSKLTS